MMTVPMTEMTIRRSAVHTAQKLAAIPAPEDAILEAAIHATMNATNTNT